MSPQADVRAENVVQEGPRMRFTLRLPQGTSQEVVLALPGRHNVLNALGRRSGLAAGRGAGCHRACVGASPVSAVASTIWRSDHRQWCQGPYHR